MRQRIRLGWLNDFVVNTTINNPPRVHYTTPKTGYTPCTFPYTVSPCLNSSCTSFLANISDICEPRSYNQAKDSIKWQEAMKQELEALEGNKTWEVTELPPGCKAIGSRWVYKVKNRADGGIDHYKARLVARDTTKGRASTTLNLSFP